MSARRLIGRGGTRSLLAVLLVVLLVRHPPVLTHR